MPQETLADQNADPEVARAEIERTRARMSETIDEIEGVLLRKKEEIEDKLDIGAPIRERPLPSLGIALGAGIVLGFLTGGDDDEPHHARGHDHRFHREMEERAETWELRARRLMRIAQEQEAALRRLGVVSDTGDDEITWNPDPRFLAAEDRYESRYQEPSRLDQFRDMISDRVSTYLSDTVRQLFSHPG